MRMEMCKRNGIKERAGGGKCVVASSKCWWTISEVERCPGMTSPRCGEGAKFTGNREAGVSNDFPP